jgi:hypothetical protein
MARKPPPLPHEILERVLQIATVNGRLVMIVATVFALLNAAAYQGMGAIVGCLVAGAGALELHGAGLLRAGSLRGVDWLVRSQLLLLATMLIFSALRIASPDLSRLDEVPFTPEMLQTLEQLNLTKEQFATGVNTVVYVTVGLVTLIYQGVMAIFYHRRRGAIATALHEEIDEVEDTA